MTDSSFWVNLKSIKKTEKVINSKYFQELNSAIFVEKKCHNIYAVACIPVFRDILVFKKKNKVIGLAKICFKCGMYHIEGSNSNVECFGMDKEYKRLKKLLDENSASE